MANCVPNAQSDSVQEVWLPVVGWEGMYDVSDLGRVRSLDRDTKYRCFCGHGEIIRKKKGKVLSPVYNIGYPTVMLADGDRRERWLVHRLVCAAFHGPAPAGKDQAAHGDGDPSNPRANNLRWVDCRENMADKWRHGTMLNGDDCPWTKISDAEVQEIRRNPRVTNAEWAHRFGVEKNHISKIVVGSLRANPGASWDGEWLPKAPRLPYGNLTSEDKAFILANPEISGSALAEKFSVSVRRITNFRSDSKEQRRPKLSLPAATRAHIAADPDSLGNIEMARRHGITAKQVAQIRYWYAKRA
jgi:hypothetical protein